MRLTYDGESDTLSILMRDGQIHHAEECGQIILNFDENDKVVEIEILNASEFFGDIITGVLRAKPGTKLVEVR